MVTSPRIEFRLLGPFEVLLDGQRAELGGARARAVLAILLRRLRPGSTGRAVGFYEVDPLGSTDTFLATA
jgi:hypothetical protein